MYLAIQACSAGLKEAVCSTRLSANARISDMDFSFSHAF